MTWQAALLARCWWELLHLALVGLREVQPPHHVQFDVASKCLMQCCRRGEAAGMQQKLGELAINVIFASYNIHLVWKYRDLQ